MDRIAKAGLRYTQFHSTALCSPTRAALITGRNHHSVGFGVIGEMSTGYPGLRFRHRPGERHHRRRSSGTTVMPPRGSARTTTRPTYQYSAAGPFDQWPSGMGFEYFYGFMGGETDQWTPYLFRDHTQIFPWVGKPGYNLTTDMADEAIKYMRRPERGRARQAVLPLLRARRHPLAAPADAGMDREVQGQVRHGLGKAARADLRQPEAARRDPGGHPAHAVAGRACRKWDSLSAGAKETLCARGGGLCRLRRLYRL